MNSTRRLILAAAVLMLLISSASAQDSKGKKVDYTGTQEVDISVGLPYGPLFRSASIVGDAFAGFNFISPSDIVTGENKTVLPTFRAQLPDALQGGRHTCLGRVDASGDRNLQRQVLLAQPQMGARVLRGRGRTGHRQHQCRSGERGGGRRTLHQTAADI